MKRKLSKDKNGKAKRFKRLGMRLIAAGLILLGGFILIDLRIRPIIEKTSSYQSRILATRIINNAVYEDLGTDSYDYGELVTLTAGADGRISAIESNIISINRLKTKITQDINEAVKNIDDHDLGISLGTVSGIHVLYGKGPVIPIKVSPKGYANSIVISEFTSAGINQTLHRIILEVSVDISAIIPGYTTSVEVKTPFIIAETVIVGSIPEAYTHIVSGNPDLINDISDYGAKLP